MTPEPQPRNLVTDLQPHFPYDEEALPFISTHEAEGFRYILQFEDGWLIGAVCIPAHHAPELSRLLVSTANPAPETPKLEVARS